MEDNCTNDSQLSHSFSELVEIGLCGSGCLDLFETGSIRCTSERA